MSATAPEAAPTRVARPKTLRDSLLDMGRSLGLMLLILAFVMLVTPARGLIFPDRNDRMPATDWSDVVAGFGQITHQTTYTPAGLPASWRSNAAYLTGSSAVTERLHIGFVTAGSHYAEVDETAVDAAALIADVLGTRGPATPLPPTSTGSAHRYMPSRTRASRGPRGRVRRRLVALWRRRGAPGRCARVPRRAPRARATLRASRRRLRAAGRCRSTRPGLPRSWAARRWVAQHRVAEHRVAGRSWG